MVKCGLQGPLEKIEERRSQKNKTFTLIIVDEAFHQVKIRKFYRYFIDFVSVVLEVFVVEVTITPMTPKRPGPYGISTCLLW